MALGLLIGAAVDDVVGDPRRGHPVAAYGRLVAATERLLHADDVQRGAWFVGAVTVPLLAASVAVERALRQRPLAHTALVAAATWCVLGGTSLTRVGDRMAELLTIGVVSKGSGG